MDILDRIQKLVNLAVKNPNEEESRSAALKAVRLMCEHNVVITLKTPQRAPEPAYVPYQPPYTPRAPYQQAPPMDYYYTRERAREEFKRQATAYKAWAATAEPVMSNINKEQVMEDLRRAWAEMNKTK